MSRQSYSSFFLSIASLVAVGFIPRPHLTFIYSRRSSSACGLLYCVIAMLQKHWECQTIKIVSYLDISTMHAGKHQMRTSTGNKVLCGSVPQLIMS